MTAMLTALLVINGDVKGQQITRETDMCFPNKPHQSRNVQKKDTQLSLKANFLNMKLYGFVKLGRIITNPKSCFELKVR